MVLIAEWAIRCRCRVTVVPGCSAEEVLTVSLILPDRLTETGLDQERAKMLTASGSLAHLNEVSGSSLKLSRTAQVE